VIAVERHQIRWNPKLKTLCGLSRELYNRCNFLMRRAWVEALPLPDINTLVRETQGLDCFKQFHNTKTAKQTIRKCLTDWSNFKKARNAYFKDSSKFLRRPKAPGYKDDLAQVIFYWETLRQKKLKNGLIQPTNDVFCVKSDKLPKQVVITPRGNHCIVEIQYEVASPKKPILKKERFCSIDLGVNNLATIASDQHSPVLINGRIVKSFNRYYNKNRNQKTSSKRYWRLQNYFHQTSRMIVDHCVEHQISKIVIGKNDGWKTGTRIKRRSANSQNFQSIPFNMLIEKIQYKAQTVGIDVILTEEAYTSKASFLDRDEIPKYEKGIERTFSGHRIKRGLYRSLGGVLLNADVNGAANIGRKVFPNMNSEWDRSVAATPVVVNPLRRVYA